MHNKLFNSIIAALLSCALLFPAAGCSKTSRSEEAFPVEPEAAELQTAEEKVYPDYSGILSISEIMPKNRATLMSPDGSFEDWVELYNAGEDIICLDSWFLKSKQSYFSLDGFRIAPGEYLVVFIPSAADDNGTENKSFSLKDERRLALLDPSGREISVLELPKLSKDMSYASFNGGEPTETIYATPGYPNTDDGYTAFLSAMPAPNDLMINEAMCYNTELLHDYHYGCPDWAELKNNSDRPIQLGNYYLSDDADDLQAYQLPDMELAPGEFVIIPCTDKVPASNSYSNRYLASGFALSSSGETLYLSHSGRIIDYISLKSIPVGSSCGRISGGEALQYFPVPSPGSENTSGCYMFSEPPAASVPGGCYELEQAMQVELSGSGSIYYTLDSSLPTVDSRLYTGPISISETTVLRAINVENGKLPSSGTVFNYIINEGHSLPVLCLNADNPAAMRGMYKSGDKEKSLPANISFYEENGSFSENCSVSLNGGTSLLLEKKNMIVSFKAIYGTTETGYDIFGDGRTGLSQLVIRAGQDYITAMIRNELCQTAAAEFSGNIMTTRGRWCVLYLNGQYYGIYSLKEDDDKHLYSDKYGVAESSVETVTSTIPDTSSFYDFINYINKNDMSDPDNYEYLCSNLLDINSFVDWIICEGIVSNTDLANGNLKYCRSTEDDGLARLVFYDLDAGFTKPGAAFLLIQSSGVNYQIYSMHAKLMKNPEYRALLLSRLSDALSGAFSIDNLFRIIDEMTAEISADMPAEMKRWGKLDDRLWQFNVDNLRKKIVECRSNSVSVLKQYPFYLTDEEYEQYFSDIVF